MTSPNDDGFAWSDRGSPDALTLDEPIFDCLTMSSRSPEATLRRKTPLQT